MTGRVGRTPPQITHLVKPEQDKKIIRSRDVKVEVPKTVDLQKMQALAERSRELGKVGTKAQILALKAEIKSMNLDGISPPPELSTMETLKKFGVDVKKTIGGGLSTLGSSVKELMAGKFLSGKSLTELGMQVEKEGQSSKIEAEIIRAKGKLLVEISDKLEGMLDDENLDVLKVSKQLEMAQKIFGDLELGTTHSQLIDALSSPENPLKLKEAAQFLKSSQVIIEVKAATREEHGRKLKSLGFDIQTQGGSMLAGGTSEILQKASPITVTTNFVAQSVYAAESGRSLVDVITAGSGAIMSKTAYFAVSGSVGGLQIISEGLDLYNNSKALNSSLKKVEMAKVLLAGPEERQKMAEDIEAKIQKLDNPGRFKKLFSTQSGRQAEKAKLAAKLAAIKGLPSRDEMPQEAKAVAEQVLSRADTKFKMAKIAKNVLGIAAGAITIAVAVGALATPVGWVAAGISLTAAMGCVVYSLATSSARQTKIDNAQNSVQQSEMKLDLKKQQVEQLKSQITAIQHSIQDRDRDFQSKLNPTESEIETHELNQLTDSSTLKRLQAQLKTVEGDIELLEAQHSQAVLQLTAVSPKHASEAIIKGVREGDPAMNFLAERILGVKGIQELSDSAAIKLLSRGMSIYPEY